MAANLTPQYQKAEASLRRANSSQERVECLERMLQLIPRHKGTERLQADLKTKLKEARDELRAELTAPRSTRTVRIPRQGAGTVIVVGAPNAGKSRLVAELTGARPEVAPWPYTTREPSPGMLSWEDVTVQLIDTPPITAGHFEPTLNDLVRAADAAVLCFNGSSDDAPQETLDVLDQFAARKTRLATRTGYHELDMTVVEVRTVLVVTHAADADCALRLDLLREQRPIDLETLFVEFDERATFAGLKEAIFRSLDVMRVYTRRPGEPAERTNPFTLPQGGTVADLAERIHDEVAAGLSHARVWPADGSEGQTVQRDHVLREGDLVELHLRSSL